MPLSPADLARYQRHLALPGFGLAAQEKLAASTVLVIGAGGLGCPALLYLAAAGVGRLIIVDDDRVDLSNLQRQILFTTADAGALKAEAAARRLAALNPGIALEPHAVRFTRANALDLVRRADVVVDGSDNFATRYLVNDACVLAGRPFVYGAIQAFEGQLSVFNHQGGPTYRCLFPEPPDPGTVPNCADAGVLGVLPGLIGTAQACEALKLLTGLGTPLSGKLLLLDALAMTTRTMALAPDPHRHPITDLPPEGYGETCAVPATPAATAQTNSIFLAEGSSESPVKTKASASLAPDFATALANAEEIPASLLRAALASAHPPQLLDVRETWERTQGTIAPDTHVPLRQLVQSGAPALDPAAPVIVYCAVGARSLRAARLLRTHFGFTHVASLSGGLAAWQATAPSAPP